VSLYESLTAAATPRGNQRNSTSSFFRLLISVFLISVQLMQDRSLPQRKHTEHKWGWSLNKPCLRPTAWEWSHVNRGAQRIQDRTVNATHENRYRFNPKLRMAHP